MTTARLLAYIERYGPELAIEMMEGVMNVDDYEDHVDERERDEKMNRQQAIIDALMAAPDAARRQVITLGGDGRDWPHGDTIQGAVLNQIDAALAMARKGG